jgi:hypothetical protein
VAVYISIESVTIVALIEIPPPDAAKRTFFEGLGVPDHLRKLHFSLPLYAPSLSELKKTAGGPLQTKLLGWQFLTTDAKGAAVAGEVPMEPDVPEDEMETSLTRGIPIDEALKASIMIREEHDRLKEQWEFRRLRISFLRIDAFWLKSFPVDDFLSGNDRVYSFVTFEEDLKAKLVPGAAFLAVVRQMAARPMARNAPPSSGRLS